MCEEETCRVLVIDDDQGMRETIALMLKKNCDVHTVGDAEQGVFAMERHVFEVVLCDVRLPGMNGLEFLKISRERWPSTEVIVISVLDDVSIAVEAMRLGAFFYTTKAFDLDALNTIVMKAMEAPARGRIIRELRAENLELRREIMRLTVRSRMPTNIADRRTAKSDRRRGSRAASEGESGQSIS